MSGMQLDGTQLDGLPSVTPLGERQAALEQLEAYRRGLAEPPLLIRWHGDAGPARPTAADNADGDLHINAANPANDGNNAANNADGAPHINAANPANNAGGALHINAANDGNSAAAAANNAAADGGPALFVLSTDEVDRHGDVVAAEGWNLEFYRRNPVLLWAHDYRRPAIGRAVSLWTEPHRLLARMEFAPTAFAQEVAALYRAGFQWGVSVGFRPLEFEERRDAATGAFLGIRFLRQELLEVSAVTVPANRSALRRPGATGGIVGAAASASASVRPETAALQEALEILRAARAEMEELSMVN